MLSVYTEKKTLIEFISSVKNNNSSIGFVPTMGALHEGHLSLIQQASEECDFVVCSIFVNPTQFNEKDDFNRYPRIPEKDFKLLNNTSCGCIFAPATEEIYEQGNYDLININLGHLDTELEGKFRPGHFKGVVTVVKKLFDIVRPDKAYFGIKDFQQLLTIKQMVTTFNMTVEIVPCAIIREADGLAMSSRNMLLNVEEREYAPAIHQCLLKAKEMLQYDPVAEVEQWAKEELTKSKLVDFEYFEIRNAKDLSRFNKLCEIEEVVIVTALRVGKIRLIDNISIKTSECLLKF